MRFRYAMTVAVLMTCAFSALADNWSEYREFTRAYYELDPKLYSTITCKVDTPILATVFDDLSYQYAASAVTGTWTDIVVVVRNTGQVEVQPAILTVAPKDPNDKQMRDTLPSVIPKIQDGFKQINALMAPVIKGAMRVVLPPDPAKENILSIERKDGATIFEIEDAGAKMRTTLTARGSEITQQTTLMNGRTDSKSTIGPTAVSHFHKEGAVYVLDSVTQQATGTQGEGRITYSYQDLSGIRFLKVVDWFSPRTASTPASLQEVEFKECAVVK